MSDGIEVAELLLKAAGLDVPSHDRAIVVASYEALRARADGLYLPEAAAEVPAPALAPAP